MMEETVCSHCSEPIEGTPDGEVLCADCRENTGVCEDCGERYDSGELAVVVLDSGTEIPACAQCREGSAWLCAGCGKWYESTTTIGGEEYCGECREENFVYCDRCEEYTVPEEAYRVGEEMWCAECYVDHASRCSSCGDSFPVSDGAVCEECGRCTDCGCSCEEEGAGVHEYHYRPNPVFERCPGALGPALGIEVETERTEQRTGTHATAGEIIDRCGADRWYAKTDGSLQNGVEFVSHPAVTERWADGETGTALDAVATALRRAGFRGDRERCGIHVHVERAFFDTCSIPGASGCPGRRVRVEAPIARMIAFLRSTARPHELLARRASGYYYRYHGGQKIVASAKGKTDRYQALNATGRATVEIRIWRSSLRGATIRAALEHADALARFARDVLRARDFVAKSRRALLWARFGIFVRSQPERYGNLLKVGTERGVFLCA